MTMSRKRLDLAEMRNKGHSFARALKINQSSRVFLQGLRRARSFALGGGQRLAAELGYGMGRSDETPPRLRHRWQTRGAWPGRGFRAHPQDGRVRFPLALPRDRRGSA